MNLHKARDRLAQAQRFQDQHWDLLVNTEWNKLMKGCLANASEPRRLLHVKDDFLQERRQIRRHWRSYDNGLAWQQGWLAAKEVLSIFNRIGTHGAQSIYSACDKQTKAWLLACQLALSCHLGAKPMPCAYLSSKLMPLLLGETLPWTPHFVEVSFRPPTKPLPTVNQLCQCILEQALAPMGLPVNDALLAVVCQELGAALIDARTLRLTEGQLVSVLSSGLADKRPMLDPDYLFECYRLPRPI
jgi:hypothetical protein